MAVNSSRQGTTKFHGYQVTAALFVIYGVAIGGVYYIAGPLVAAILTDRSLGWSFTTISGVFTVRAFLGILSPIVGLAVARFGARRVIIIGGICTAVFTALTGAVVTPLLFYLIFGLALAVADGFMGYLPVFNTIQQWFVKRRALMIGIVAAAGGVGGFVFAPFAQFLIQSVGGWRPAMVILGAAILVLGVLPAVLWVRNKPEDVGELPDGAVAEETVGAEEIIKERDEQEIKIRQWSLGEALRSYQIWLLMLVFGAEAWALGVFAADQVVYLSSIHINALQAATALGATGLVAAAVGILIGPVSDRFGPYYMLILATVLETIGAILLLNAQSLVSVYFYVILFGAGYGILVPTIPSCIGAYYGRKNYALIYGWASIVVILMAGIGPLLTGYLVDANNGSFVLSFQIIIGLLLVSVVMAILARPPAASKQASVATVTTASEES